MLKRILAKILGWLNPIQIEEFEEVIVPQKEYADRFISTGVTRSISEKMCGNVSECELQGAKQMIDRAYGDFGKRPPNS